MSHTHSIQTQAERADQTRTRILDAAVLEFSENGLAGARTERIAEAAGVNKALLYYYFKGKDALYRAAMEYVARRTVETSLEAMAGKGSAGELILRFTLDHFDRIHSKRAFQKLMQQEMVRLKRGEQKALTPIIENVFHPMMMRLRDLFREGRRTGELIKTDEWQIMYSALGANVFYFLSSPVIGIMLGRNPLERSAMEFRRKAAIEFLGQAIFNDRRHGAVVAKRVLRTTPMPESNTFSNFERNSL
jgi:TetR/AcrR family transcriptional regulator